MKLLDKDKDNPRTLTRLYVLALSFIAFLAIIAQFFIQYALNRQLKDAYVVNMAGRQRMLSQKITKNCLLLQSIDSTERKKYLSYLIKDLSNWEHIHFYFLNGDSDLHFEGEENSNLADLYASIHPSFKQISASSHSIIKLSNTKSPDFEIIRKEVKNILKHEGKFLNGMNQIVFEYEGIAERKIARLKEIETLLLVFTLLVLIIEGFVVFRPAMRKINSTINDLTKSREEVQYFNSQLVTAHKQLQSINDQLEARIEERTKDLENNKKELQIKNFQLEKLNKELDTFIYSASHDLKAPINNIEGLINGLYQSVPEINEKAPDFVQLINQSIVKFKNLLIELSDTAKAKQVADGEKAVVKFSEVLEEIRLTLHEEIIKFNAKIEEDFTNAPEIKVSQKNLRSILYNLISNSIKYRSPTQEPRVEVVTKREGDYIVLSVKDNGLGIKKEDIPKLFSIYERFHDHVEGTGVGMSIVKKMVDNEGAHIQVESILQQGTTIRIQFPDKV